MGSNCCLRNKSHNDLDFKIEEKELYRYKHISLIQKAWKKHMKYKKIKEKNPSQNKKDLPDESKNDIKSLNRTDIEFEISHKDQNTAKNFNRDFLPGIEISEDINKHVPEKIKQIEDQLGEFIIEEKELLLYSKQSNLQKISLKYSDRTVYSGYMNYKWQREGFGILIMPDGSKYRGFHKRNKLEGRGRLIGISGEYYEGKGLLYR